MSLKSKIHNLAKKLFATGHVELAKKLASSYYKPMAELLDPFKYPVSSIEEYRKKVDSSQADFTTEEYITPIEHNFTLNKGLYSQQDKIKSVEDYKKTLK